MATKVVTFRLSADQVEALETVARFDGVTIANELREAVQLLLVARSEDPEFRARVQESFDKVRGILQDIEGGEAVLSALKPDLG